MQENKDLKNEDYLVLKFLSKYIILKIKDASYVYNKKRYYRNRINNLIKKDYVKRYKTYILISKNGRKALGKVRNKLFKKYKQQTIYG